MLLLSANQEARVSHPQVHLLPISIFYLLHLMFSFSCFFLVPPSLSPFTHAEELLWSSRIRDIFTHPLHMHLLWLTASFLLSLSLSHPYVTLLIPRSPTHSLVSLQQVLHSTCRWPCVGRGLAVTDLLLQPLQPLLQQLLFIYHSHVVLWRGPRCLPLPLDARPSGPLRLLDGGFRDVGLAGLVCGGDG